MPFILLELANYLEKDTLSPTCFNQEASSSADPQGHGGECDRQTVPRLHLHSPPSGTRASGPDLQHISCQQLLDILEDFIIFRYRNLDYILGYRQEMFWCLRGNVMKSKTLAVLEDLDEDFFVEDHVATVLAI